MSRTSSPGAQVRAGGGGQAGQVSLAVPFHHRGLPQPWELSGACSGTGGSSLQSLCFLLLLLLLLVLKFLT